MASSRVETQVLWATASSKSISSASNATSDAHTFNAEDWDVALQVNADNDGTAATGDTVDVYVLWTTGDVLTGGGSDYDTVEHAHKLGRLNTYAAETPGEDPACRTWFVPSAALGFKLHCVNNSAGRAITVKARVSAHRPQ